MTYIFTEKADEDLSEILSDGVDEYGIYSDCRRVILGAHSIYYRIEADDIVTGRVLRAEMDFILLIF